MPRLRLLAHPDGGLELRRGRRGSRRPRQRRWALDGWGYSVERATLPGREGGNGHACDHGLRDAMHERLLPVSGGRAALEQARSRALVAGDHARLAILEQYLVELEQIDAPLANLPERRAGFEQRVAAFRPPAGGISRAVAPGCRVAPVCRGLGPAHRGCRATAPAHRASVPPGLLRAGLRRRWVRSFCR